MSSSSSSSLPSLNVREFYSGKTILCTGCTGFLGKVILEKILRVIPDIHKIYVLVRPKKGITDIQLRVQKEIIASPIFDRLRKQLGEKEFDRFANEKLVAVAGDVATEKFFFLEKAQLDAMKEEIELVIHSAATIGFHERVDHATKLNTLGAYRCMLFAKQCKKIKGFCHISTAYVNSNRKHGSTNEEKQYEMNFPNNEDIEDFINRVIQMSPTEAENAGEKILKHFKYPNTYTFTKCMAEHLVSRHHGDMPVAILRPTIIGSSFKDPHLGWVDAATAAGSVYLSAGLGVLSIIPGRKENISDHIPVDFVANGVLVSCVKVAKMKEELVKSGMSPKQTNVLRTFHCGSSSRNPVTWGEAFACVSRYWQSQKPKKSIASPDIQLISRPYEYNLRFFTSYYSPAQLFQALGAILRQSKYKRLGKLAYKLQSRATFMDVTFRHFTLYEWIFDTTNLEGIYEEMSDEEKDLFLLDVRKIDWYRYFQYFCWGLHKYVLKEKPVEPTSVDITKTESVDWFSDIAILYSQTASFVTNRSKDKYKKIVLFSSAVQQAIQKEAETKSLKFKDVEDRALQIMDQMFADPRPRVVQSFLYILRKAWRILYQSIYVSEEQMDQIRALAKDKSNGNLIIIPTHRSYVDFLIMSYLFYTYNIPVPHIAAGEDFLNMFAIRNLFRHSGAFFLRRQFGGDDLYKSIFTGYIQKILEDGAPLEFFVEGTRSRAGKTLQPKLGLLSIILNTFLDKKVQNLTILPINIGYEKILEGKSYAKELLGEKKTPETLSNLVKASTVLSNKYGNVSVNFSKPISLKNYTQEVIEKIKRETGESIDPFTNEQDRKKLSVELGYQIAHDLNKSYVCTCSSIIAMILLTNRDGMSVTDLKKKVMEIKNEVEQREFKVLWRNHKTDADTTDDVVIQQCMKLLSSVVTIQRNMIEPKCNTRRTRSNIVHLAVYRNQMAHIFIQEAIIVCALSSLQQKKRNSSESNITSITKSVLKEETTFLEELLQREFVYNSKNYEELVDKMVERGYISVQNNEYSVCRNSPMVEYFIALVHPFVESYWVTTVSLISSPVSYGVQEPLFAQQIQWLAEKAFEQHKTFHFESCSMDTIKNAIHTYVNLNVLKRVQKEVEVGKGTTKTENLIQVKAPYTNTAALIKLSDRVRSYLSSHNDTSNLSRSSTSAFFNFSKL